MKRNQIKVIEVNGNAITSHSGKTEALTGHLKSILATETSAEWRFDPDELYIDLPRVNADQLVAPFTTQEAVAAVPVRAMNRCSALGPDGFGPGFYQAAWAMVEDRVMEFLHAFQIGQADMDRINRAFVVLIPKRCDAVTADAHRPICLQNCGPKIVSKILTTRLQEQITTLVDTDQTGFIRGRSISENFILATELVQCCYKRRAPTLVLKLDFAKAFDTVNSGSLLRILHARGFPDTWQTWIKSLLSSSKSAVLVNGVPGYENRCRDVMQDANDIKNLPRGWCLGVEYDTT